MWCVTGPTRDVARHRITYTVQTIILNEVLSLPIPLAHTCIIVLRRWWKKLVGWKSIKRALGGHVEITLNAIVYLKLSFSLVIVYQRMVWWK